MNQIVKQAGSWTPRVALLLCGAMLSIAGISGALNPEATIGAANLNPESITALRVDFGGFHLGLAMLAFYGFFNASFLKPSLIGACTTMGLVVIWRVVGMTLDGVNDAQIATLALEALTFSFAVIGLIVFALRSNS